MKRKYAPKIKTVKGLKAMIGQIKAIIFKTIDQEKDIQEELYRKDNYEKVCAAIQFWENTYRHYLNNEWADKQLTIDNLVIFMKAAYATYHNKISDTVYTLLQIRIHDLSLDDKFKLFDEIMEMPLKRRRNLFYNSIAYNFIYDYPPFSLPEDATYARCVLRAVGSNETVSAEDLKHLRKVIEFLVKNQQTIKT